jgi:hypothetical protein
MQVQFYGRLGWRGWAMIVIGLAASIAITVAVAVVAVGAMLVLVPALALAAAASYLVARFRARDYARPPRGDADIIDADFHVVEEHRNIARQPESDESEHR